MIEKPYNKAFAIPFDLDFDRFVKNVTVIGIIGKTHGVNRAINPPPNPLIKITHNESFAF